MSAQVRAHFAAVVEAARARREAGACEGTLAKIDEVIAYSDDPGGLSVGEVLALAEARDEVAALIAERDALRAEAARLRVLDRYVTGGYRSEAA